MCRIPFRQAIFGSRRFALAVKQFCSTVPSLESTFPYGTLDVGAFILRQNSFNMSCDPSYLSPKLEFGPYPPAVEASPKPGKRCGIYALLCGAEPFFAVMFCAGITPLMDAPMGHSMIVDIIAVTAIILVLLTLPCATAGIVLGIIGRNTEGRIYANIGLLLSLVFCLLLFVGIVILVVSSILFSGGPVGGSGGRCC